MSKAKGGAAKTANKGNTKTAALMVTSDKCERCPHPCPAGMQYVASLQPGKFGKGVHCKYPW